ncbi:Type 1 glutamine amidotransferase-like domain-containing protein [Streptomyces avermitilis]|uniref:Type 1 glutamine amidotransferase-like domain-containing protein n=1 Tax=Streptomyces avermitilis TaxID=33903 RepID=UPI0033F5B8E0
MHTYLIGGGWDERGAEAVYGPFLEAAGQRAESRRAAGDAAVVGCLLVDEGDGVAQFARYEAALRKVADCAPVPLLVPLGERFDIGALARVDALLVCGGLTPAYQDALAELLGRLPRVLAERGIPYAGFSAGAAVAARRAVVGGWIAGGVPVCSEDAGEDLDEIEVREGLGLVPFGVDVHAAQWGTLPRLIAAVADGRLSHGVAIDENTLLTVDGRTARVSGLGRVHAVRPGTSGGTGTGTRTGGDVLVRSYAAGESFAAG